MNPTVRQRGVVAVEAALVIALTMILLPLMLYVGRLTWHAIVLNKAVHEASQLIAALPRDMVARADAATSLPALAHVYVTQAVEAAGLDIRPLPVSTQVNCNGGPCGLAPPTVITVDSGITFTDPMFNKASSAVFGAIPPSVVAIHTVSYVP